jgi:hypothetical protein
MVYKEGDSFACTNKHVVISSRDGPRLQERVAMVERMLYMVLHGSIALRLYRPLYLPSISKMTKNLRSCILVSLVPKKKDRGNESWKSMRTSKKKKKNHLSGFEHSLSACQLFVLFYPYKLVQDP